MSTAQSANVSPGQPRRSILLVAYFFPPCRDTGAQRPTSMARHLAALGHKVTVLTTSAYGNSHSTEDLQLLTVGHGSAVKDGPSSGAVEVVRTRDLQQLRARLGGHDHMGSMFDADSYSNRPHPLSRVIVPEPLLVAWAPFAMAQARRLQRSRGVDCVITTSPPESAHRVGKMLAGRSVPWVADLRDGWSFEPLRPRLPAAIQRRLDLHLERRWLTAADVVSCVSAPVAEDLRVRGIADPIVIPNGWDPAGTDGLSGATAPPIDPDRVSLVYTGRFGSYGRDPSGLVAAFAELARADPDSARRLELLIAGPLTEQEQELFKTDVSPARITALGSVERPAALALQRSADALLVVASPSRSQLANLKLYEYLAAGPPILGLAGGTEAGRITAEAGGTVVSSEDVPGIVSALRTLARDGLPSSDPEHRERYIYPPVAERMADAVELALERRRAI